MLLSTGAASDLIGPGYGWTPAGELLFLNALEWAKSVEQALPPAPTIESPDPALVADPALTLRGTAEFRSTVTVNRGDEPLATAAPARDGTFAAPVTLREGPNELSAIAENYAGESAPSAPVTVTLDTTGPTLAWTPSDRDGFFGPKATVRGTVSDAHAGVSEVLVNGQPAAVDGDGEFAVEVTLAEGENTLTVVARDRLGNETAESHTVRSFRYTGEWQVVGTTGKGRVQAFLRIVDPQAGQGVEVGSAVAELLRADGTLVASTPFEWEPGPRRYRADFGKLGYGSYRLRGLLVVEGWNVVAAGPSFVRKPGPGRDAESGVPAGAAAG